MAILDDELFKDAAFDTEVVNFVRESLPENVAAHYSDDDLYYIHDLVEEYLADSDALDAEPDEEGFVNIEIDAIVAYVIGKSAAEKQGSFNEDEVAMIVEAELSYGDDFEDCDE